MNVLSLGWGVQSWTIAAMAAVGELPQPDLLIHADTRHERQATYDFATTWAPWLQACGLNIVTVTASDTDVGDMSNNVTIPAFTCWMDGRPSGMLRRQCTNHWKIRPIRRYLASLLKEQGRKKTVGAVKMWLGITLDEVQRVRDSNVQWIKNSYPLLEMTPPMTRLACVAWLESHNLPIPPKSSCVFCPYQNRGRWSELKKSDLDWQKAVQVDEAIRHRRPNFLSFVHRERIPLIEVVSPSDAGQLDMFDMCESGYCFA